MRIVDITLPGRDHISSLVNITNRYPFTIMLRQGHYVVDGKSVLGVCSLYHPDPVTVEIYSEDCEALINELQPLMIVQ